MAKCGSKCEVYSRVVGYYRPVADWNVGKKEEFSDRLEFVADRPDAALMQPAGCGCSESYNEVER